MRAQAHFFASFFSVALRFKYFLCSADPTQPGFSLLRLMHGAPFVLCPFCAYPQQPAVRPLSAAAAGSPAAATAGCWRVGKATNAGGGRGTMGGSDGTLVLPATLADCSAAAAAPASGDGLSAIACACASVTMAAEEAQPAHAEAHAAQHAGGAAAAGASRSCSAGTAKWNISDIARFRTFPLPATATDASGRSSEQPNVAVDGGGGRMPA